MEERLIESMGYVIAAIIGGLTTLGAAIVAHFSRRTKISATAETAFHDRVDKKTSDLMDRLEKRVDTLEGREEEYAKKYSKLEKALEAERRECDEKLDAVQKQMQREVDALKHRVSTQEEMSETFT